MNKRYGQRNHHGGGKTKAGWIKSTPPDIADMTGRNHKTKIPASHGAAQPDRPPRETERASTGPRRFIVG